MLFNTSIILLTVYFIITVYYCVIFHLYYINLKFLDRVSVKRSHLILF
ncbi:hypothetical protein [Magpiepox virus 2]|nr:hypothetical protein [Magpiepox virus 2]